MKNEGYIKVFFGRVLVISSPIKIRPDAKIKNFASEMFLERGYLNKMVG